MDADKNKKSYLPRSWGSGREERHENSSAIADDIQRDSQENDAAEIESSKAVLQSSRDIDSVGDQCDQSEKAEEGSEEDVSTKARILEVPTKACPSAQTIVENIDFDVERVPNPPDPRPSTTTWPILWRTCNGQKISDHAESKST
jgi:hypothetical protein